MTPTLCIHTERLSQTDGEDLADPRHLRRLVVSLGDCSVSVIVPTNPDNQDRTRTWYAIGLRKAAQLLLEELAGTKIETLAENLSHAATRR